MCDLLLTGHSNTAAITYHLRLNRRGCWGTTDDFTISFLHFSLFTTALWVLVNSSPVQSLMLYSHLFFVVVCLVFFPLSLCLAKYFWPDLMNGRHVHTTSVCISKPWSGGLHVVQLSVGSLDRLIGW